MLERFLFQPHTHYQYVGKLSGGEKRRLYLLTVLMKNPNFLVLDEPTNDLDIQTLSALEDYLEIFEGCVLLVTHDRFFMNRVVDHIFVFEEQGNIKDILGNYNDYREEKRQLEKEQKKNEKKVLAEPVKNSAPASSEEKKKMSYKEKFEFEQLEKQIPELEKKKAELEEKLSSPSTSTSKIMEISTELGHVMEELDAKTERWLILSEYSV